MSETAVADTSTKTVTFAGTKYNIQELGDDRYTVLLEGAPVGRIVFSFGCANGVSESDSLSEDDMTAIGEAWFAALG